jgi:hypothetical protein
MIKSYTISRKAKAEMAPIQGLHRAAAPPVNRHSVVRPCECHVEERLSVDFLSHSKISAEEARPLQGHVGPCEDPSEAKIGPLVGAARGDGPLWKE